MKLPRPTSEGGKKRHVGQFLYDQEKSGRRGKEPTFCLGAFDFAIEKYEFIAFVCATHESVELVLEDARGGAIAVETQNLHSRAALLTNLGAQTTKEKSYSLLTISTYVIHTCSLNREDHASLSSPPIFGPFFGIFSIIALLSSPKPQHLKTTRPNGRLVGVADENDNTRKFQIVQSQKGS